LYLCIVVVENVVVEKVGLDRVQVQQNVVKLAEEEEAGCHALPPWDRVTLAGTASHELKVLLGTLHLLPLIDYRSNGDYV
jgi:hypothetical protein